MLGYRLYFIGQDGHIKNAIEFECAGDRQVISVAASLHDARDLELWIGARIVAKMPKRENA